MPVAIKMRQSIVPIYINAKTCFLILADWHYTYWKSKQHSHNSRKFQDTTIYKSYVTNTVGLCSFVQKTRSPNAKQHRDSHSLTSIYIHLYHFRFFSFIYIFFGTKALILIKIHLIQVNFFQTGFLYYNINI